jgi:hypothetical protein
MQGGWVQVYVLEWNINQLRVGLLLVFHLVPMVLPNAPVHSSSLYLARYLSRTIREAPCLPSPHAYPSSWTHRVGTPTSVRSMPVAV